ncbi:MAG: hypothetical protein SH818_07390 [Saprospiraceae bacterium]|nr:hypothetical protein [Saprospiraceae bacterium]
MSGQQLYNTPLLKKIGAKENQHLLVLNPPSFIRELLIGEKLVFQTQADTSKKYDLIWLFTNKVRELESGLKSLRLMLNPPGIIWVSWYKKSSRLISELNEDIIRDTALALDLVDIKVASVDPSWSALKLVIPLNKR